MHASWQTLAAGLSQLLDFQAQGELFKADGELVGARPPPKAVMPFLLSSKVQPLAKNAGPSEVRPAKDMPLRPQSGCSGLC